MDQALDRPSPTTHFCDLKDLDYQYNDKGVVYRIVCRLCNRQWHFYLVPAKEGNGKLVGFWGVNAPYPRLSQISSHEWSVMTANNIPAFKTPSDFELEEKRRKERLKSKNLPKWNYSLSSKTASHTSKDR